MQIDEFKKKPETDSNSKLNHTLSRFSKLLDELRKKSLPDDVISTINNHIHDINDTSAEGKHLKNLVKKKHFTIVKLIEKKLKIVPRNYYQNIYMAMGMGMYGLPLGVVFGISLDNMAYLSIGLPIGMAIGIAIGSSMDKKALEEGRQLDLKA